MQSDDKIKGNDKASARRLTKSAAPKRGECSFHWSVLCQERALKGTTLESITECQSWPEPKGRGISSRLWLAIHYSYRRVLAQGEIRPKLL
jgi:hypothetical protein